jgi:hypothetical protein
MSISKTAVRLSAAALVVAGGMGTVWAASPTLTNAVEEPGDHVMGVSYEVKKEAIIEVTANNPKDDAILNVVPTVTEVSGPKNGNLGIVRVKTNSPGWDVTFTTANGGKLAVGTKTPVYTSRWDMGCMCLKVDTSYNVTGKTYLAYSDAGTDHAQLNVAIGMLDNVNGTTKVLKGVASLHVGGVAYPAAPVAAAKLTSSASTDATGATISATSVSFIDVLSDASTGIGQGVTEVVPLTVGGVEVTASTEAQAKGFGPTATEYPATNYVPRDGYEYFFINVGLPSKKTVSSVDYPIGGNPDGVYEEEFKFTLKAIF